MHANQCCGCANKVICRPPVNQAGIQECRDGDGKEVRAINMEGTVWKVGFGHCCRFGATTGCNIGGGAPVECGRGGVWELTVSEQGGAVGVARLGRLGRAARGSAAQWRWRGCAALPAPPRLGRWSCGRWRRGRGRPGGVPAGAKRPLACILCCCAAAAALAWHLRTAGTEADAAAEGAWCDAPPCGR